MTTLRFPSLDALRLALTSGLIPVAVRNAPAVAGLGEGEADAVWLCPSVPLAADTLATLRRLGVQVARKAAVPLDVPVGCWPQLIPVAREGQTVATSDATPVLFELDEAELPELVGEILRLGNDRQGFRMVADGASGRALLRVVGPPYYSLLRALDRPEEHGPVAYVERAPGVWIEIGYAHPLANRLRPPPGKWLLMRPPRRWTWLDEAPFREIYEVLDFVLPQPEASWRPAELSRRLRVPLRLGRGGGGEPAELWVLRERGEEQLDALVAGAGETLLERLAFAVGEDEGDGRKTVVLRVRPSKQPPPVLVLDGVGFRPYLRLPNLFLPCGTRLHPPLRRDAVARLLASDPGQVTWLWPQSEGTFRPEGLPDDAFQPLARWVDYVLDHDHRALRAWIQASRFDFEPFVCRDDPPEPSRDVPLREPGRAPSRRKGKKSPPGPQESIPEPTTRFLEAAKRPKRRVEPVEAAAPSRPDVLQQQLHELEDRFVALDAPLDAEERRDLWRALAGLNAALGRGGDLTVCWANAVWERPEALVDEFRAWRDAEAARAGRPLATAADLDPILASVNPTTFDLRALATYLAWSAHAERPDPSLPPRLGRVQHFLERHEGLLPVRLAWLAWAGLVAMSRGDVLALAHARDRLLERLFHQGLSADLDLPGFLRLSGGLGAERARKVRDHLLRVRALARGWVDEGRMTAPHTGSLADLTFAYGLARVGDADECQKLMHAAVSELQGRDRIASWFSEAYRGRIQEVLEGKPGAGSLPRPLLKALESMDLLMRSKVDRLRKHSRILEPHEKIDPYRHWKGRTEDALSRALAELFDVHDRAALADRLTRLLHAKRTGPRVENQEASVLSTALELAPRLGEGFARDLFGRVLPAVEALAGLREQAGLLEKGLYLAAHYDRPEHVQAFVARFHRLLAEQTGAAIRDEIEPLLGQCFLGLRKLGMRDEIGALLEKMAALVLRGQSGGADAAFEFGAAKRETSVREWSRTLRLLLHVASGWSYFGQDDRARPLLDEARDLLFEGDLVPLDQTKLACGYVAALGHAPIELALPRIEELFGHLERVHDTFTTNSHYSLSRMDVIETVMLTLISDDLMYDRTGRRWLDEDEFLVRRRIHRDVRAALGEET